MKKALPASALASALLCASALVAPASAPAVPKRFFGADAVTFPTQPQFQAVSEGGVRAVRVQVSWRFIEQSPGARNWGNVDALVANAARADVELVPLLFGVPAWISPDEFAAPIRTAVQRQAWAQFVADAARRYGPNGAFWALNPLVPQRPIRSWQAWNEPNLPDFWNGRPSGRQYARLLKITAGALRGVDPGARVIAAGLLPYRSVAPGSVAAEPFLRRMLRVKGVRGAFDALAIHPYSLKTGGVLKLLRQARLNLREMGAGREPIWVTEFGWTTGGADARFSPVATTEAGQARRVGRTMRALRRNARRLRIQRVFYFSLTDLNAPQTDSWQNHMGLLDASFQPKPAWYAYTKVAR